MAYANNYTYMYGFSLLDDLHNFFPEIMYDEILFPEQRFGWFRHRASTLFPNIFTRQMNMYRIYSAVDRQHMFQEWVQSQQSQQSQTIGVTSQPNVNTWANNPPPPPPQVPPSTYAVPAAVPAANQPASYAATAPTAPAVPTVPTAPLRPISTLRYSTPVRTHGQSQAAAPGAARGHMSERLSSQTPQRIPPSIQPTAPIRSTRTGGYTFGSTALGSDVDILTALFSLPTVPTNNARTGTHTNTNTSTSTTPTINSLFGANEILSLLTNSLNFQDVLVVPTLDQIDAASRIILHAAVPSDEYCAICQEHAIPGQQSPWRRLHCSHQFHTACIMTWFQRDVHCPVCRADVRELGGDTSPSTPSDDMSLSSNEPTTDNPPASSSQS